ncbi:fungal specific transcription factor domain-containing protein [Candidatus Bathyarchaeota archaeon]|nr:fungal specific transcription factor domain-containing protein [Candidatus Bathyarchaeota archaeon]
MIVIVDKCLSLRLGRPSAIRDSDFTLERVTDAVEDDISALGPASILPKWIDFSLLQGQVFDDIYSPAALLRPESIRVARERALATDLQRVFEERTPAETHFLDARRQALGADMHDLLQGADRINFLATLTLVYRAIPAGPQSGSAFCEECIATAYEALSEHQKCLAILRNVEGSVLEMYLQW